MHLTQRLSSQDANPGDTFGFDTSSSVEVEGYFLAAETHGRGIVLAAQAARGAVPGKLVLEAQTLDLPDGKKLAVGLGPGQLDRTLGPAGPGSSAGTGRVAITFGARPTNVVYEKGTPFIVIAPPPPTAAPDDGT